MDPDITERRLRDLAGQAAALTTLLAQLDRRRARLPLADRRREVLTLVSAEVLDALRETTAELLATHARARAPDGAVAAGG